MIDTEKVFIGESFSHGIVLSRRRLLAFLGTGVTAVVTAVVADILGVVWDGDELCHHYCRVSRTAVRESPPDEFEVVSFDELTQPAQTVVESVLSNRKYLTCHPHTDPALNAFIKQTTFVGTQWAMIVERGDRYHWFVYQIEDVRHGRSPV